MGKKILIHCGSGNLDRPERWGTISLIFKRLAESLRDLGFSVTFLVHPKANRIGMIKGVNVIENSIVDRKQILAISPDKFITWNGNSEGDIELKKILGHDRGVYGELGFFGHYDKTCYFDNAGINTNYSMIGKKISSEKLTYDERVIINTLRSLYQKPRIFNDSYVFVPLQDETDTQITKHSPYKSMNEVLEFACDIFKNTDAKILYKKHPRAPSKITVKHPKLVEVTENVHHYIPHAEYVFGLNSTVMVETLMYHGRLITYGAGVASRHFENENERLRFVVDLYEKQFKWNDLKDKDIVQNSELYNWLRS